MSRTPEASALDASSAASRNGAGRPTKYTPDLAEKASKLLKVFRHGATDAALAEFFGVSESTFNLYQKKYPEFSDSIKGAKEELDAQVEKSLFERARGYSHPESHVSNYKGDITITPLTKHYPPDTAACFIWLKNRQPTKWRDKVALVGGDDGDNPLQVQTQETPAQKAALAAVRRRLNNIEGRLSK